jgi:ribonuclease HII
MFYVLRFIFYDIPMWLIGIDEVGRGPLAGPVCIGLCKFPAGKRRKIWKIIEGVKDSKKLSEAERHFWSRQMKALSTAGMISYHTSFVSHAIIDRKGIAKAVRLAIKRTIKKAELEPKKCEILLDGSLRAPKEFKNQKTIIKGDEKEPIIALASIVAKVRRDNRMKKLAKKYPGYGFEIHKGYGTKEHIRALKKLGPSDIHRQSFIAKIMA